MKHTKKKKLLAFVLCMVLVLSTAITAFAVDGNFYYVPKDTVELSHEIMKDGASQGTLYATVPGGTFKSSTDNAELQMDMQEETSESTVLEAVQTELENTGNTGYTVHQAVMGDVSFRVSTEDKAQIPEKAVNFRFENTSLDTAHAMGFVYDSSDETITLYELKEDTLQFEEDVKLETETVVVGCFDVLEKTAEEKVEDGTEPEDTKASTGVETITQESNNIQVADAQGKVSIAENYGKLTANYSDTAVEVGYVWYRSINGATEEQQIPTQYYSTTGTNLGKDISTDGKDLYIALNGGALKYNGNETVNYKVKAYAKNDLNEYGLPKEGTTALATSSVYNVTGYYEVQNGSFETPSVTELHSGTNNWQFSNENYKKLGGVWQTTGTHDPDTRWSDSEGADIEIVTTTSGTSLKRQNDRDQRYNWHGDEIAADGNQFAELNCAAAGALYQDVLTTPGEVLNYQVAHRARGSNGNDSSAVENDTMYVVAMSSDLAKNITTQAQVLDVVNNKEKYPGAMVATYTDGDRSWTTHQGTYTVASNQYSTRFFFVAGSTASNIDTVGNFIDNVRFTRDRLTPVAGTANITVTKTITGLSAADAETLDKKLSFKVGNVSTLSYNDMTWTYENGVYRGSKPVVAYRYIENYVPQALSLTKTLSDNEAENVFTFKYAPGATNRVVETVNHVTVVIPGNTITNTVTIPAGTTGTTGGNGTGANGTNGTGANGTTGTNGTGTNGTGTTTPGGTDANGGQDADQNGTVENPDEQTPQDQINLDDEDTPTGNIDAGKETQEKNKTLGVSIAIIVAAVVALIALFVAMKRRKKETK